MGYLYKLITIPKEDEFHSLSFIFHSAKNNIRILRTVCFYIQNKDENKEQVEDVKKISNILFKYYFEFFYYVIDSRFIDEPLKVEALIKNHIKEIIAVNDSLTQDIENFKPNDLLKTAITELQKIIKEVTEQLLYFFTPDFEKQMFNTIPPPEPKTPFNDPKTHKLFNYIVNNWNYDKGQKWADIWNVINDLENYTPPYKNEYQNYIITRFGYTGKFQYDKPKKDGNRDKQNLLELIETFSKK